MDHIITCQGLTKRYGNTLALNDISLAIPMGRIVGLLGPNGSGKTTFIKIICGLLEQTKGEILIDNNKPGVQTKSIISYLSDKNYLPGWMSIPQLIGFYKDFYSDFDCDKAYYLLKQLNIPTEKKINELSKGTKEKVQLIMVMSRNAKLYILDEPIAGVDPAARDLILNIIIKNYNPESTLIISTHLIADIEPVLDDFIFIKNGVIELVSPVDKIRTEKNMSVDELFREVYKCY